MLSVTIFYRKDQSSQLKQIKNQLSNIQADVPHHLVVIDIESEPGLEQRYAQSVPFIQVGPYKLEWEFTQQQLFVALAAARDRNEHLEKIGDKNYENRKSHAQNWSGVDRFAFWFTKNYMWVFNLVLFLYVGIPFLAPILMRANMPGAAKIVYTMYRPLCHQLAYRSLFLFGEQPIYPRELAGIESIKSYETVTGNDSLDVIAARNLVGDEHLGYKIALCERDIAIWGSLFLFGVIFTITKYRIKPLNWIVWIIIGVLPMGLDGGSQLISVLPGTENWFFIRESTPTLRFITGTLFGFMTAWMLFPLIEINMKETRAILTQKSAIIKVKNETANQL